MTFCFSIGQIGESVNGSYLVVHLIREYHFFEGMEQSVSLPDPKKLIRMLELLYDR